MEPVGGSASTRGRRIDRLASATFDVLVVGGGATGAGVACAAARSGAAVALVDRGDVAGETSSASSKLVHGGLRYLALGDVRLVREAHRERRWNAQVLAPHLVWPLPFVVPLGEGVPHSSLKLRAGVLAYAAIAGFRGGRSGPLPARTALALAPGLRRDLPGRGYAVYHDHTTDDARLVLTALQTAARDGATWANYVAVDGLRVVNGRVAGADARDVVAGERFPISARVVVNAAGPWVDEVRALEDPRAGTSVRLSKGAHLVLHTPLEWRAAVTTPLPGERVAFAVPWHGMLLLGTTDEPFAGPPAPVEVTERDRTQILTEAAEALDPGVLDHGNIRAAFAGLRVLPRGRGSTARARRETVVTVGPGGMISVAGGKLTTWRRVGVDVAVLALRSLGRPAPRLDPVPLLGAATAAAVASGLERSHPDLPAATRAHLARQYGDLVADVLRPAAGDARLLEPVVEGAPEILAQVRYAVDHELAVTADDVLRRRTTLAVRGLSAAAEPRVTRFLA